MELINVKAHLVDVLNTNLFLVSRSALSLLRIPPPFPSFPSTPLIKHQTYHNKAHQGSGAEDTGGDLGQERAQHLGRGGPALPVGALIHHLHGAA